MFIGVFLYLGISLKLRLLTRHVKIAERGFDGCLRGWMGRVGLGGGGGAASDGENSVKKLCNLVLQGHCELRTRSRYLMAARFILRCHAFRFSPPPLFPPVGNVAELHVTAVMSALVICLMLL
jgi:hypothetical protein